MQLQWRWRRCLSCILFDRLQASKLQPFCERLLLLPHASMLLSTSVAGGWVYFSRLLAVPTRVMVWVAAITACLGQALGKRVCQLWLGYVMSGWAGTMCVTLPPPILGVWRQLLLALCACCVTIERAVWLAALAVGKLGRI